MGMNEAMKEMYKAEGVVLEIIRKLEGSIPKPGKIKEELSQHKTQKDFDKDKKRWKDNLDKGDDALIDLEDALKKWDEKIESCLKPLDDLWKRAGEIDKSINDVEAMIKANNAILEKILYGQEEDDPLRGKSEPRQIVKKDEIRELQFAKERWSNAQKTYADAKHQVMEVEKKLIYNAGSTRSSLQDRLGKANKEFNETKFSCDGKAGKKR